VVLAVLLALRERHVEGLGADDAAVHVGDGLGGLLGRAEADEAEALGAAVLLVMVPKEANSLRSRSSSIVSSRFLMYRLMPMYRFCRSCFFSSCSLRSVLTRSNFFWKRPTNSRLPCKMQSVVKWEILICSSDFINFHVI